MLARGQVQLDGRVMRESDKGSPLRGGAEVAVRNFVPPTLQLPVAQPDPALPVLSEGDGWVVLDKPAGMPVHPLSPDERGTLLNRAIARYPQMAGVGEGGLRSGVVHRLDVETSGCIVVATTQLMWLTLTRAFHEHDTTKVYLATVGGRLEGGGREEVNLVIARHHPARVKVLPPDAPLPPGGRRCYHTWRVLRHMPGASLIEIDLGTGFLHQIRASFAHRGHPVLGDAVYGDKGSAPRLMLHATHLAVGPVSADAPVPTSFG